MTWENPTLQQFKKRHEIVADTTGLPTNTFIRLAIILTAKMTLTSAQIL